MNAIHVAPNRPPMMVIRFTRRGHRTTYTTYADAVGFDAETGNLIETTTQRIIAYLWINQRTTMFRLPNSTVWYDEITISPENTDGIH